VEGWKGGREEGRKDGRMEGRMEEENSLSVLPPSNLPQKTLWEIADKRF